DVIPAVGRVVRRLLHDEPQVLRGTPAEAQKAGELVVRRRVLSVAQALRLIDAAPVDVQEAPTLRGDVARAALGVSEADHRRERRCRKCTQDREPERRHRAQKAAGPATHLFSAVVATGSATVLPTNSMRNATSSAVVTPSCDGGVMP